MVFQVLIIYKKNNAFLFHIVLMGYFWVEF